MKTFLYTVAVLVPCLIGVAQQTTNTTVSLNLTSSTVPVLPKNSFIDNLDSYVAACPDDPAWMEGGRCHILFRFSDLYIARLRVTCIQRPKLDNGWTVVDCSWRPAKPTGVACYPGGDCTITTGATWRLTKKEKRP
jgi:hypothetical protein